jgi:glutamine phosphoribosylpyrophosphate amidotransferase
VSELSSDCPLNGGLGIAFFRPSPIFLPQYGVIPLCSTGHIAVAYLGVIDDNISEIREKLISDGYQFNSKNNVAETLCYLLDNYLADGNQSPIDVMMKKLKGNFALMSDERKMVDGRFSLLSISCWQE